MVTLGKSLKNDKGRIVDATRQLVVKGLSVTPTAEERVEFNNCSRKSVESNLVPRIRPSVAPKAGL